MKTKVLSLILTAALILGITPVYSAGAEDAATLDYDWYDAGGTEIEEEIGAVVAQAIDDITGSLEGGYGANGKFLAGIEEPDPESIAISSREDLEKIGNYPAFPLSGNYRLTADIDLSGEEWTPIGDNSTDSDESRFSGVFDGQGYVIRNLTITGDCQYAGLFGSVSGAIKNVGLEDTYIDVTFSLKDSGYAYAGGICGYFSSKNNYSSISNCYNTGVVTTSSDTYIYTGGICGYAHYYSLISNCYNTGDISASSAVNRIVDVGGICGYARNSSTINSCYNTGSISVYSDSTYDSVGGICGESDYISISNCYNTGDVSASSYSNPVSAGGICGHTNYSSISNCYNTGDVSASSSWQFASAGGICSDASSYSEYLSISNCYNTGSVSASSSWPYAYAGGICGGAHHDYSISNCYNTGDVSAHSSQATYTYVGGICGYSYESSLISNCYNTGDVSASSDDIVHTGGICGYSYESSSISNCYNTGAISASSSYLVHAGGICGYLDTYYAISNTYWRLESDQIIDAIPRIDAEKRGVGSDENTTTGRLTSAQMRDPANFAGFDFDTVWDISPAVNGGYPYLRNMLPDGDTAYITGDVNGDGIINMQDVLLIYQSFRGKITLEGDALLAADVNGDKTVNMLDVLSVYQYFRGKISSFEFQ